MVSQKKNMSTQLINFFLWLFISIKIVESETGINELLPEHQSKSLTIEQGNTTETTLEISWSLPFELKSEISYRVKISPNDAKYSDQYIKQFNDFKTTNGTAIFYNLTPGKFYNVTVKTEVKHDAIDYIIKNTKEFQIPPMVPSNVSINYASITKKSFVLTWDKPSIPTEFDGYKIKLTSGNKLIRSGIGMKNDKYRIFHYLNPGKKYSVEITTYSKLLESLPVVRNVTMDRFSSIPIDFQIFNETNLSVMWEDFDDFQYKNFLITCLRKDTNEIIEKSSNDPRVTFENLYPGATYKIRIFKVNNDEEIIGQGKAIVPPKSPENVEIRKVEEKTFSALITWKDPVDTIFDGYEIFMNNENDFNVSEKIETINNNSTNEIEISNLIPGMVHRFEVAAVSFGVKSLKLNQVNFTVPPKPPVNVTLTALPSKKIEAVFCKPEGKIDTYEVIFSDWHDASILEVKRTIPVGKNTRNCEIEYFNDLQYSRVYKFSTWTVSHDIQSEIKSFAIMSQPPN